MAKQKDNKDKSSQEQVDKIQVEEAILNFDSNMEKEFEQFKTALDSNFSQVNERLDEIINRMDSLIEKKEKNKQEILELAKKIEENTAKRPDIYKYFNEESKVTE